MRQIYSPLDGFRSPFGRLMGSTAPFTPAVLFGASEPGVWYDPSDVANLAWRRNFYTQTTDLTNLTNWPTSDNANAARSGAGLSVTTNEGYIYIGRPANSDPVTSGVTYTLSFTAVCNQTISNVPFRMAGAIGGSSTSASRLVNMVAGVPQRVSLSITPSATGNADTRFGLDARNAVVPGGSNDTGYVVTFSDPQFEVGSAATDYQKITDVNTEVIERFPSATLYQDTAGTQPVTTPGQTVALALDKSKGLVLGSEQIVNGSFGADTNWTKINGATISGGVATLFNAATTPAITQTRGFALGRTYKVSLTWTGTISAGIGAFGSGDIRFLTSSTLGSWTGYVTLSAGTGADFWVSAPANVTSTVDNISVKELPGFHATQATLASRPTYGIVPLGGRRNLLTYSEEVDNAAWTKSNVTVSANAGVAPNGTTTADRLTPSVANSTKFANATPSYVASISQGVVHSCYVKADGYSKVALRESASSGAYASFDISAVSVIETGNAGSVVVSNASVTSVGSGWYRIAMTCTNTAGAQTNGFGAWPLSPSYTTGQPSSQNWIGNGTSGILIWGAQLETGSSATAYQRVGSAFDVTEAGVASLSYLSFDGVDDFLLTPTITPGIDKVQTFAGVRKLSDAAAGEIVGLSTSPAGLNGTFFLRAPSQAAPNYQFRSRGTTANGSIYTNALVAAPVTNVLGGIGDISAPNEVLRVNGVAVASSTLTQGTGNYGNYPLYIGRVAGTSQPFNGNIFSLLVRFGTNLDAGTITSTETWVNGKTGAYA